MTKKRGSYNVKKKVNAEHQLQIINGGKDVGITLNDKNKYYPIYLRIWFNRGITEFPSRVLNKLLPSIKLNSSEKETLTSDKTRELINYDSLDRKDKFLLNFERLTTINSIELLNVTENPDLTPSKWFRKYSNCWEQYLYPKAYKIKKANLIPGVSLENYPFILESLYNNLAALFRKYFHEKINQDGISDFEKEISINHIETNILIGILNHYEELFEKLDFNHSESIIKSVFNELVVLKAIRDFQFWFVPYIIDNQNNLFLNYIMENFEGFKECVKDIEISKSDFLKAIENLKKWYISQKIYF